MDHANVWLNMPGVFKEKMHFATSELSEVPWLAKGAMLERLPGIIGNCTKGRSQPVIRGIRPGSSKNSFELETMMIEVLIERPRPAEDQHMPIFLHKQNWFFCWLR